MPLDDVWKTFQRSVGIYSKGRFDDVPAAPGVYAWFYPLRVTSYDLDTFLTEVRAVHLYDGRSRGAPRTRGGGRLGWTNLVWNAELENPQSPVSASIRMAWNRLAVDRDGFEELRRVLLRASLLMPPLYVGKATDLRTRCSKHLSGGSDFGMRYEQRANEMGFSAHRVRDLLLVTMRTETVADDSAEVERLVEEILKLVGRPAYGLV